MEVIDLKKLAEYSRDKGLLDTMKKRRRVKKDLLRTKNYNIVLVCLDAGQEIPSRPEPYDVCFYVVEGSGTFTVDCEKAELSSGQMVFVPANVARGMKSKEHMVVLGIQEPH
ncbi:MAG: cupin domain-containing protein [Candidatus Bathyarchaeota archaeon]|jgi:quercetin dioxygenase-like cupin family protein|nr:cupin domain-containing protein [Candidatus Bathyarchaeota archaeon A05DMB-3]MDH7607557.1 cupin domain-containing protein [Candidatus Bathyarchaeota archaeon]